MKTKRKSKFSNPRKRLQKKMAYHIGQHQRALRSDLDARERIFQLHRRHTLSCTQNEMTVYLILTVLENPVDIIPLARRMNISDTELREIVCNLVSYHAIVPTKELFSHPVFSDEG